MSSMDDSPNIILASGSPRRRELLSLLGLEYQVKPAEVDETRHKDEAPEALALRLPRSKAEAADCGNACTTIGADTIVVLDGQVLGKPVDRYDASAMLHSLRERKHSVLTGVCILSRKRGLECVQLACTSVHMRAYSDAEIEAYISSGDPLDKAGAYAIQNTDFRPVDEFKGCYTNIIGLPLCHVYRALKQLNLNVSNHPLMCCPWSVRNGCIWADAILNEQVAFSLFSS
ncbi:MAG: Maf family protein [Chloroflexi bacterium]|nr:Maf family protein [Chloroflexota bacterium]